MNIKVSKSKKNEMNAYYNEIENIEKANFCYRCGEKLDRNNLEYCPNCGNKI